MRSQKTQLISQGADAASLPQKFPFVYFWLHRSYGMEGGAMRGVATTALHGGMACMWQRGSKEQSSGTCPPEVHFWGIGTRLSNQAHPCGLFWFLFEVALVYHLPTSSTSFTRCPNPLCLSCGYCGANTPRILGKPMCSWAPEYKLHWDKHMLWSYRYILYRVATLWRKQAFA